MYLTLNQKYSIGLKTLKMTHSDLAKTLGFSRTYVTMLINGERENELFTKWMDENVLYLFRNKRSLKKWII